jgi:hypothetical protein
MKPNFLVVGAAKSGTTTLFHWLKHHPDCFLPEMKECRYFSQLTTDYRGQGAERFINEGIRDRDAYAALFQATQAKCRGECSNDYLLHHQQAIPKIKAELGDEVKIVILLRNPIERAYSNYLHHRRENWESLSFEGALQAEDERIAKHWAWSYHYKKAGLYSSQVQAYLSAFPHVHIVWFEAFQRPQQLWRDLLIFLGCDDVPLVDPNLKRNMSGEPKSDMLHRLMHSDQYWVKLSKSTLRRCLPAHLRKELKMELKLRNQKKVEMPQVCRDQLRAFFREDIQELSAMLKVDLNHWLS